MSVVILYGTESGNAEIVADSVADVLTSYDPSIYDMSDYAVEDLDAADFYVIVCSTYGDGELPTGAEPFAEELDEKKPDLTGLKFAVFGLGDSIYDETFNHGGEIMAKKLSDLGATQVGDHGRHDAASAIKPTLQAEEWAGALTSVIDSVTA